MVSTYHAFAGSLLRDYGLLLPVEPDTRLLSETELWQLAFDVVNGYGGELRTDKTPAAVTSMVLRLWGQLAEHLVDTRQLRDTHVELERLVHALPAGPYQRDRGPSQWLLRMLATQTERAELVPLLDALQRAHARREGDGLRCADGFRRTAGGDVPAGRSGPAEPLPGGAARRIPGHRARPARRAVGTVRRWLSTTGWR